MKKFFSLLIAVMALSSCTFEFGTSNRDSSELPSFPSIGDSEPSISVPLSDPYTMTTREQFYASYSPALSYEEASYRTKHGFMSGDITPQQQIPASNTYLPKDNSGKYYRVSDANYKYDAFGNYLSYRTNKIDGSRGTTIYYGGAYTSLEEVAAYLLAFGEVPPNSNYDSDPYNEQPIDDWGEYGRKNIADFTNDTEVYKYEPSLASVESKNYIETDFGTTGYKCGNYPPAIYNNGYKITRGAARFCFTSTYKSYSQNGKITDIAERHVFYTYNHYNDFQEYLNYEGGWGQMFGFETAGNDYCSGRKEYAEWEQNGKDIIPPTPYVATASARLSDIK